MSPSQQSQTTTAAATDAATLVSYMRFPSDPAKLPEWLQATRVAGGVEYPHGKPLPDGYINLLTWSRAHEAGFWSAHRLTRGNILTAVRDLCLAPHLVVHNPFGKRTYVRHENMEILLKNLARFVRERDAELEVQRRAKAAAKARQAERAVAAAANASVPAESAIVNKPLVIQGPTAKGVENLTGALMTLATHVVRLEGILKHLLAELEPAVKAPSPTPIPILVSATNHNSPSVQA